jgi:hypothetical protein
MADDTDGSPNDTITHMDTGSQQDEASMLTPQFGAGARQTDKKLIEQTIKFEFNHLKTNHKDSIQQISMVHTLLLHAIENAFPQGETIIFNNKGRKVQNVNIVEMSQPLLHQTQFKIHTSNSKRAFVIHRIHTTSPLSHIRNQPAVFQLLQQYNVFLRQHSFTEDIWDTIPLGFMIGTSPTFYTSERAAQKLTQQVITANKKAKLPQFKMVFSSPSVKSPHDGRQFRTKAYTIEVNRQDGPSALRILKDTFRETCQFVPMKMKYVNPPAFAKAIQQQQTKYLNEVYVVPMMGMTDDALLYISDPIKAASGVIDIVPTKNYNFTGRYNILVKKSKFKETKAWLNQNFQIIYNKYVAEDAKPHADAFSGPPRIATDYGEDDSSGADSYMSMSAASFTSFNTTEIFEESDNQSKGTAGSYESINNTSRASWASVARRPPSSETGSRLTNQNSYPTPRTKFTYQESPPTIITQGDSNKQHAGHQPTNRPRAASPISELTRTDQR